MKGTAIEFFIPDFNLLSCELDHFMFKVLYWVILYWYFIKTKQNYNTLIVLREKSKIVSIASSVIKNVTVLSFTSSTRFRFPVELICCLAFGSKSGACYLLISVAISL